VPVTKLQAEILEMLAAHRGPTTFVAGSIPLNLNGPRYSQDIDIFHEAVDAVGANAARDIEALEKAGLTVTRLRQLPSIVSVEVRRGIEGTKVEWVADSDFRYFPPARDATFGYAIHPADLAVNKLMAAVGRREPRDVIDLLTIHETYLPLGAVAWAAVEVAPGFTPEGLIAELRRNARYREPDYAALNMNVPIVAAQIAVKLRSACDHAEKFIARMPTAKAGRLFLQGGRPVQPDPGRLGDYLEHSPSKGGSNPSKN
jgi:hypothetical protein